MFLSHVKNSWYSFYFLKNKSNQTNSTTFQLGHQKRKRQKKHVNTHIKSKEIKIHRSVVFTYCNSFFNPNNRVQQIQVTLKDSPVQRWPTYITVCKKRHKGQKYGNVYQWMGFINSVLHFTSIFTLFKYKQHCMRYRLYSKILIVMPLQKWLMFEWHVMSEYDSNFDQKMLDWQLKELALK